MLPTARAPRLEPIGKAGPPDFYPDEPECPACRSVCFWWADGATGDVELVCSNCTTYAPADDTGTG